MSGLVAAANLALGGVFLFFAGLLAIELRRNLPRLGWSHLGVALLAMAVTCGPHHLVHGMHVVEGQRGAGLDLVATSLAVPFGVVWVALRVEAFRGGRGDRFVAGNPPWVLALPTLAGMVATGLAASALDDGAISLARVPDAAPNLLLVPLYALIAFYLARTQVANRRPLGGWSLSGLCLSAVFFTCTLMHALHALLVLQGAYRPDAHLAGVDWLSVPAAAYFLSAVVGLHRGRLPDWNRVRAAVPPAPRHAAAVAARARIAD